MALLICFISVIPVFALAETPDTRTHTTDPFIRTLQTRVDGNDMVPPIITLDAPDGILEISFDELADEYRQLRYEIIHCDSRWKPSEMITEQEYVDGMEFNRADIDNYSYSQPGLSSRYVHYVIPFPDSRLRPAISGNYILRVFPYDDPDKTLLVSRFMVSEQATPVTASVNTVTDIDYNDSHQQLEFSIDISHTQPEIVDPFSRIKAVIYQNMQLDNATAVEHPSRIEGRKSIVYDHLKPLIFQSGNEYRRFETVATNYTPLRIDAMEYRYPYYHMWIETDTPRNSMPYSYDETQRGRFRIRNANASESDTESEYVVTHFKLEMPPLPDDIEVVIDGDLTYRGTDPAAVMSYDPELGAYTRALLLKQGSYNYRYITRRRRHDGTISFDASYVEGNKYQTQNEYLICIYYTAPGERYERLLQCASVKM